MDTNVGRAPAETSLARLLGGADSEILLVEPGGDARWSWPFDLTPLVDGALDRGVRVRVLFGRLPSAAAARIFAHRATVAGAELRAGGAPDQAMMSLDTSAALIPSDASTVTVVTQPQVVRVLRGLADLAWSRATAVRTNAVPGVDTTPQYGAVRQIDAAHKIGTGPRAGVSADTSHRSLQQRIVQLLAAGAKDETIARSMGMSVRTCRRHIADIMRRLDAVSRFQAGANAVRIGLAGADGLAGIDGVPRR